ncbi:hypothetical protein ACNKHQ_19800 [Shigella flexneri]
MDDGEIRKQYRDIKLANKERLVKFVKARIGIDIPPATRFLTSRSTMLDQTTL